MRRFLAGLGANLRPAFEEIIAHFAITALTLLSLAGVEWLLEALHIAHKVIPRTELTLSDWMLWLDVVAATGINVVGMYRAVQAVLRG